jgi:hypothetical protein
MLFEEALSNSTLLSEGDDFDPEDVDKLLLGEEIPKLQASIPMLGPPR